MAYKARRALDFFRLRPRPMSSMAPLARKPSRVTMSMDKSRVVVAKLTMTAAGRVMFSTIFTITV